MALYYAAKEENWELIDKIKGLHYINIGLYGACESGNLELVKYMVKLGAWNMNEAYLHASNDEIKKYLATFNGIHVGKEYVVNVPKI
jgi:hypothetical protein